MPSASCCGWATPFTSVALAFSVPPTLAPIGLGPPGTPRLNEPMFWRKAFRYWLPTGLPKTWGGVRSVKMVFAAGGGVKFRLLIVQLVPPWQLAHPAWVKSARPLLIVACDGPFLTFGFVRGAFGVRIANRTHSLKAVSAGTWVELPGSVTVTCWRFAFATGMKLGMAHGGWSMLPLSP